MADGFNGLGMGLGNLSRLSKAQTRSISAENFTGEKGKAGMATEGTGANCARDLGRGWKVSPSVVIKPGQTFTLADIAGPGAIQSIWLSGDASLHPNSRHFILRMYWDDQEQPSVESPAPDFFAAGWGGYVPVMSMPVMVGPNRSLCCFWEMPFRKHARITLENLHHENITIYWQINYTLTDVPEDCAYFHAQFRRVNPLPYKDVYTIIDGIKGRGHYVGTYMAWGINNNGWWGEGEIKFFMDGDFPPGSKDAEHGGNAFPTICGTGTEDYFLGCYDFDVNGQYVTFTGPFAGMHQVTKVDGLYKSQHRHAMYRWHIMDPVRFEHDLRVTIQALGWRVGGRYLPVQDDMASVAFWYQTLPTAPFSKLPDKDYLEII
jgi:hypothetical protein